VFRYAKERRILVTYQNPSLFCSFCLKICAVKRYVKLVCEYKINLLACLDIPDPCISAHGERICKCSCLCLCLCQCQAVQTSHSVYIQRVRQDVFQWPRCQCGVPMSVWPCTAWWLVCIPHVVCMICNCLVTPSKVQGVRYCRPTVVEVGTWRQILPKLHRVRFYETRSGGVHWLRTDTQVDTTRLFLHLFVEYASEI